MDDKTKFGLDIISHLENRMKMVNEIHGYDSKESLAVNIEFGHIRKYITVKLSEKAPEAKND